MHFKILPKHSHTDICDTPLPKIAEKLYSAT